jgi:hypothetical protein
LIAVARPSDWQCAPWVHSFTVGDAIVLFDERRQELHRLSEEAAAVWELLQPEHTSAPATDQGKKASAATESLQPAFSAIVQMFARLRLVVKRGRVRPFERPAPARDLGFSTKPYKRIRAAPDDGRPRRTYRVLGLDITVTVPSEIEAARVEAVLGHVASPGIDHRPGAIIELVSSGRGYEVLAEGRVLDRCDDRDAIAPLIKAWVTQMAASRSPHILGLHCAALATNGAAVLLPAPSGTGKTTLALAGLQAGMPYLSDDLVLLSRDKPSIRPAVNALCLKETGLAFIRRFVPDIDRLPTHRRPDGVVARYLCPRPPDEPLADEWPVQAIFFPSRSDVSSATLMPRIDALARLLGNCCSVPRHLSRNDVGVLMSLIDRVPAYDLRVCDPAVAIEMILEVCGDPRRCARIGMRKTTHGI